MRAGANYGASGANFIVRVLRGVVAEANVESFHAQAGKLLVAAKGSEGLLFGEMGRQIHPDCGEAIVFVTVWRDLDCLYRWMGMDDLLSSPILGDGLMLDELEVQHYETLGDGVTSGFEGLMQP